MKETNGKNYNVDSFNLDHTKVKAPYVRKAAVKTGPKGDLVSKFDIRFCQWVKIKCVLFRCRIRYLFD